jgi:hypothetical protein
MNFSFIGKAINKQTVDDTLCLMFYEIGRIAQCHHYAKVYEKPQAYLGDSKKYMANLISMCRMYCEHQDWDYDELRILGEEAYIEKIADLRKHGNPDLRKDNEYGTYDFNVRI